MPDKRQMAKLLVDTVLHYHNNEPRAYDTTLDICRYNFNNVAYCAVGRYMTEEASNRFQYLTSSIESIIKQEEEDWPLNTLFKGNYKDVSLEMWKDLQSLHDLYYFWDITALTKHDMPVYSLNAEGLKEVRRIMYRRGLGPYIELTGTESLISINLIN